MSTLFRSRCGHTWLWLTRRCLAKYCCRLVLPGGNTLLLADAQYHATYTNSLCLANNSKSRIN